MWNNGHADSLINEYSRLLQKRKYTGRALVSHIFKYIPQNVSAWRLHEIEAQMDSLYQLLKSWHTDVIGELEINKPYLPQNEFGENNEISYCYKRAIIESVSRGEDNFISEGRLSKNVVRMQMGPMQCQIQDDRKFDGWRLTTSVKRKGNC